MRVEHDGHGRCIDPKTVRERTVHVEDDRRIAARWGLRKVVRGFDDEDDRERPLELALELAHVLEVEA